MKTPDLYRLEIAPLVILPLGRSPFFSYLNREPIVPGSLVKIPFGRREIEGVVFESQPFPGRPPHWMKYVSSVLRAEFLTQEQCSLAQAISDEYFTPLGKTLKHFLPKPTVARKKKSSPSQEKRAALKAHKDEASIVDIFEKNPSEIPSYLDTAGLDSPKHCLALLAKKILTKKQQVLVLVPEVTLIPAFEAAFQEYFRAEDTAVLHSQLADGPYFETWEKIRSGSIKIVIATRQGLFAPFKHLGLTIVAEEQDESYKQWDMSPRYDGRWAARILSELHRSRLLFVSETPSIESRYRVDAGEYSPLRPLSLLPAFGGKLPIINLKLERFRKNYSPLSEMLIARIRETLAAKQQVLLYIHRQGMSAFSVCESCKSIFRCKECGRALVGSKEGFFRCLSCSYKTGLFPGCPECGHLSFRSVGFGTERIEKEVRRAFPGAKVFRADGSTMRKPGSAKDLYRKSISGAVDILIGTQMILKDSSLPKLALIAMIDADSLLSFADFRSDERFFQHLERAVKKVSAENVIVQTFHPESAFFQRISTLDSKRFSDAILSDRDGLLYPPFSRLIAVVCQDKTAEKAERSAAAAFKDLKDAFIEKKSRARISPPQSVESIKRRKLFESSILIRIPESEDLPYQELLSVIKKYKTCVVDVDPLSFY